MNINKHNISQLRGFSERKIRCNGGYTVLATVFEKHVLQFDIGDSVYLRTDQEQAERLVTGINVRESGISYAVTCGTNESWHYAFEMTRERDIIKATSS